MLNRFDDYPVHQTPEPIAHTTTPDRNHYDRYFFNGYSREADLFFAVAMGLYPNRRVMDAAISVVRDGQQYSLHASRLAPDERSELAVGPISIDVIDPMQALRVRVAPNAFGLAADLVFRARTTALEEPRFVHRVRSRVVMDSTRFCQFGTWDGSLSVDGSSIAVDAAQVLGCRDRSWGVRGVGEREGGAPGRDPQFFWLWAPLNFDDVCTHFGVNEYGDGSVWHANGRVARTFAPGAAPAPSDASSVEAMSQVEHAIRWQPGTRRARAATLTLTPQAGAAHVIELEPVLTFQMLGIGYLHPEWGHGLWKGPDEQAYEHWKLSDLDPLDPGHIHVQQLCRARMGERSGIGVLEQLVIGPHAPSGLRGSFDGAS